MSGGRELQRIDAYDRCLGNSVMAFTRVISRTRYDVVCLHSLLHHRFNRLLVPWCMMMNGYYIVLHYSHGGAVVW